MAHVMMMSPLKKGNGAIAIRGDADENDVVDLPINHQIAMSDSLRDLPSSPSSLSKNRSQGFPLCNSKTQLLRVNALYGDEDEQDQSGSNLMNTSRESGASIQSREYFRHNPELDKSREESDFYLSMCVSKEEGCKSFSPLYATSSSASSTASTSGSDESEQDESYGEESEESEFLTEARASLQALQEWEPFEAFPTGDDDDENDHDSAAVSSCHASFDSSYDGNEDVDNSFDTETQSACCYEDVKSRKFSSQSCPELNSRLRMPRPDTKSWLEEMKNDELQQRQRIADAIASASKVASSTSTHTPTIRKRISPSSVLKGTSKMFRNKENVDNDYKNDGSKHGQGKERSTAGRQKLMRSILAHRSPLPASIMWRSKRRSSSVSDGIDERRDDAPTPKPVTSGRKSNEKEIELKRSMFGNAKVVTMDGIVESFNDAAAGGAADRETKKFAPRTDAPLTWV